MSSTDSGACVRRRWRAGLAFLVPIVDRLQKVNMQIITLPVPAQDGITRDNITVRVDAVVYFKVMDPLRAAVDVQDYFAAIGQVAQTSLRSIIGKSDLDDLLGDREQLNQGMELMIDSPAAGWGVHIDRVEIKDVSLPDTHEAVDVAPGRGRTRTTRSHHHRRRRAARPPRSSRRPPRSWPSTRRRCSCGCSRRWSRLPPRGTPRWCSRSRSSCFASSESVTPSEPTHDRAHASLDRSTGSRWTAPLRHPSPW